MRWRLLGRSPVRVGGRREMTWRAPGPTQRAPCEKNKRHMRRTLLEGGPSWASQKWPCNPCTHGYKRCDHGYHVSQSHIPMGTWVHGHFWDALDGQPSRRVRTAFNESRRCNMDIIRTRTPPPGPPWFPQVTCRDIPQAEGEINCAFIFSQWPSLSTPELARSAARPLCGSSQGSTCLSHNQRNSLPLRMGGKRTLLIRTDLSTYRIAKEYLFLIGYYYFSRALPRKGITPGVTTRAVQEYKAVQHPIFMNCALKTIKIMRRHPEEALGCGHGHEMTKQRSFVQPDDS